MIIEQKKGNSNAEEDHSKLETAAALLATGGDTTSEKPVSQTPETNNSNSRTSEVDGPKPEAIPSQLPDEANLDSGASLLLTLDSNEKSISVTGMVYAYIKLFIWYLVC